MKTTAEAPGKLILIGEYAVLENAPALVAAINRFAGVTLQNIAGAHSQIHSPTLKFTTPPFTFSPSGALLFETAPSAEIKKSLVFFEAAAAHFKPPAPNPGVKFTLRTDEFYSAEVGQKIGLGSSAALVAALSAAFHRFISGDDEAAPDKKQIFADALEIHHFAQGKKGSGIDIAASVFGGLLQFKIRAESEQPEIVPCPPLENLHLICIWSGASASTRELVQKTKDFREANPAQYRRAMQPLVELSGEGCEAYREGRAEDFLKIYDRYYHRLQEFGESCRADIVSRPHREIYQLVRGQGGYYKSSGAGGGDIGVALTPSAEIAAKIREQILHSPYKIVNLAVSPKGVACF